MLSIKHYNFMDSLERLFSDKHMLANIKEIKGHIAKVNEQDFDELAHEIWAMAQMHPEECITDGVDRIKNRLLEVIKFRR